MKYRMACFDVDGTLVDEILYIWRMVHAEMGIDQAKLDRASSMFFAGKMTFKEWADHDISLWMDAGVTKADLERISGKFSLMKGAGETLDELKARGLKLAVISGGIDVVLYRFFPDADKIFDHIVINRIAFNGDGTIKGCDVPPEFDDGEHKAKVLRMLAEREGITTAECVFVGDSFNDIDVIREAGLGIAFNAEEEVRKAADVAIEGKDMRAILRHIQ